MLKKKNAYVVAVVGATGAVGRETIEILEERKFPVSELRPLASERSEGERVDFLGKRVTAGKLARDSFQDVDIAFFSAGAERSRDFVPAAVRSGAVVIDSSSAFRRDPKVPLVVSGVNDRAMAGHSGIIANPGCAAIGMAAALKPIHDKAGIKRVVATTFNPVSGGGKNAIDELASQTVALLNFRDVEKNVYPHQIAFNCLPQVDVFHENGSTREELSMMDEVLKILADDSIRVTATAVQVPVFRGHSASVNIETRKKISANEARAILSGAPGIVVYDDPQKGLYPLAIDVTGKDDTYVGRIREDESVPNGLNMWIVLDNVRAGAALNAVRIAELLIA